MSRRVVEIAPVVADLRAHGAVSLRQIAAGLNERGIPAPRGGEWNAAQVRRLAIRSPSHEMTVKLADIV